MKQVSSSPLDNAFLRIRVGGQPQRLFFSDVSTYTRLIRKTTPVLPPFGRKTQPQHPRKVVRQEQDCRCWQETSTEERK